MQIRLLEKDMLPSVGEQYSINQVPVIYYIQDNSAVLTAHIVQHWFYQHLNIQLIDWLPKSPNLNPIENILRTKLSRKMKSKIYSGVRREELSKYIPGMG